MLRGIHHVAIICSDIERSKHFYTEILGLQVIAKNFRKDRKPHKVDLELPDSSRIELFSFPDAPVRPDYPEAKGLRHLAFTVDSVEATSEYLISRGIEVEPIRTDSITGKKFTFFRDPDNLPLELYEL